MHKNYFSTDRERNITLIKVYFIVVVNLCEKVQCDWSVGILNFDDNQITTRVKCTFVG